MEGKLQLPPLIPVGRILHNLASFPQNCTLEYIFGTQFEPAVRALVAEIEELMDTEPQSARLPKAREELTLRRKELMFAVLKYLNTSPAISEVKLQDFGGASQPGPAAIGAWIQQLPQALFPPIENSRLRVLRLAPEQKTAGTTAYDSLMGKTRKTSMAS